jgi:heme/copper-type cytochrome/quinol oxidase subunit 3
MPRWLIVLFALMTAVAFGGPLAIALVLRGGRNATWPPDRAIEWLALGGISTLVLLLMIVTIAASLALQRRERRARAMRGSSDDSPPQRVTDGAENRRRPTP